MTRNPEIRNTPVWVLPNIWRLRRVKNTKFDTNLTDNQQGRELNLDIRLVSKYCLKLSLKLFCSNYMNDAWCQIILVSGQLIATYFALVSNNLLSFSSANNFWIKFYRKVVEAEVYAKSWWNSVHFLFVDYIFWFVSPIC